MSSNSAVHFVCVCAHTNVQTHTQLVCGGRVGVVDVGGQSVAITTTLHHILLLRSWRSSTSGQCWTG